MSDVFAISSYLSADFPLPGSGELVPSTVSVRGLLWGTVEGPQIVIEWSEIDAPSLANQLRIVRKTIGPPENPDDGVVVLTLSSPISSTNHYVDFDVEECTCYFYRIFVRRTSDSAWFKSDYGDDFTARPSFHGAKFFQLLPPRYSRGDRGLGLAEEIRKPLVKQQDDRTGYYDYFNLGEATTATGQLRGPLERTLRVLGAEFDHTKFLIDCFPKALDVDTTCERFLPLIAPLVGVDLNRELPVPRQREEIKNAVPSYKIKGTVGSLESRLGSFVSGEIVLHEWADNVLQENTDGHESFDDTDLASAALAGMPGDPNKYSFDNTGVLNPWSLTVYIDWAALEPLTAAILAKVIRSLSGILPGDANAEVAVLTSDTETYDSLATIQEDNSDTVVP